MSDVSQVMSAKCSSENEAIRLNQHSGKCHCVDIRTLVFKKIAHSSAPRKDELGNIFDDFGLFFRRKSGKPFCKSLFGQI